MLSPNPASVFHEEEMPRKPAVPIRFLTAVLVLLAVAEVPFSEAVGQAAERLYVCNQNDATVSIVDMVSNEIVETLDLQQLGFTANAKPHHVAVEPDGSFWYLTLIGDNRIVKLDRDNRVVAQVEFETPGMLSLHPTEDLLFVGRSMSAVNPPPRIGMIRRSSMEIEELDVFFPRPHAMALQPRTNVVYTASLAVNQIAAVDFAADEVELLNVAGDPHALMQFGLSPDGNMLAISGEISHKVLLLDISEPMRPRVTDVIDVGRQPFDPIFTPDGRWLYLGNKADNTVTVIDVDRRAVAAVISGDGLAEPHGIAVSADGRYVYVSNNNTGQVHDMAAMPGGEHAGHEAPPAGPGLGTVVIIDTTTQRIAKVLEVGHNASGLGAPTRR